METAPRTRCITACPDCDGRGYGTAEILHGYAFGGLVHAFYEDVTCATCGGTSEWCETCHRPGCDCECELDEEGRDIDAMLAEAAQ